MKKLFILAAALAVGLASCQKGPDNSGVDTKDGEIGYYSFRVKTAGAPGATRAADEGDQPATAKELTVVTGAGALKVAVFDTEGVFETWGELELNEDGVGTNSYRSENVSGEASTIAIPQGEHYFFVFVNDVNNKITRPAGGVAMDAWMKSEFGITTFTDGRPMDIATDDKFLMGTLWKDQIKNAPTGGTADDPIEIPVTIGRLASKIAFKKVEKGTSNMNGSFTNPKFRLGTISKSMFFVGVTNRTAYPYAPYYISDTETGAATLVTSAKDEATATLGNVTTDSQKPYAYNTTDFVTYGGWNTINEGATGTDTDPYTFVYATENTTKRQDSSLENEEEEPIFDDVQFYGNTTYIQVETTYNPVAGTGETGEVYTVNGNAVGPKAAVFVEGTTFYTGVFNGKRLIFNESPAGIDGISEVHTYTEGKNYHKFPVQDQRELDAVYRNRVLRNHYYEYAITKIVDLGSWDQEVNPEEPIDEITNVQLAVTIKHWDKVVSADIVVR
jgi:hypothetical protein